MKRFVLIILSLVLTLSIFAQGFPDAQKQPRQKEQRSQHKKFKKQSVRHHVKSHSRGGSAYPRK